MEGRRDRPRRRVGEPRPLKI